MIDKDTCLADIIYLNLNEFGKASVSIVGKSRKIHLIAKYESVKVKF